MTEYEIKEQRRAELRAEDPHGRRSSNAIDHQVELEALHRAIYNLPDAGPLSPIRDILSDIVGRLDVITARLN